MGGSGVLNPNGWFGAPCVVLAVGAGHSTLSSVCCAPPPAPVGAGFCPPRPDSLPGEQSRHRLSGRAQMLGWGEHWQKGPFPHEPPKSSRAGVAA